MAEFSTLRFIETGLPRIKVNKAESRQKRDARKADKKAKALGKFKGGVKRIDRTKVNQLRSEGLSTYKIAEAMGISRMTVHRILKEVS